MSTAERLREATDGNPRRDGRRSSLSAQCGEDGDRYYRAMTDWAIKSHGHDGDLARQCVELGMAYLNALNELIDQPEGRRSGDHIALSRLRAMEYKELLLEDLRMIQKAIGDSRRDGDGDGRDRVLRFKP